MKTIDERIDEVKGECWKVIYNKFLIEDDCYSVSDVSDIKDELTEAIDKISNIWREEVNILKDSIRICGLEHQRKEKEIEKLKFALEDALAHAGDFKAEIILKDKEIKQLKDEIERLNSNIISFSYTGTGKTHQKFVPEEEKIKGSL